MRDCVDRAIDVKSRIFDHVRMYEKKRGKRREKRREKKEKKKREKSLKSTIKHLDNYVRDTNSFSQVLAVTR